MTEQDWDYNTVVLHYSGNSGEKDSVEIEKKHMGERRWEEVGYHCLITPDGQIYEGRHLAFKGSHVEIANTGKIGILIMGDFDQQLWDSDDDPTPSQLSAVESFVKTLKGAFSTMTKLAGHRDYKAGTERPGGELYKLIPSLRAKTTLGGS
jgi:N-acetyl-anhydromuramyl-L-alanine amidase AmpD